jgi:aminopeptidase N
MGSFSASAQEYRDRYNQLDVQHYEWAIAVNDSSDIIYGKATIDIQFLKPSDRFYLDLVSLNESGEGMSVDGVQLNNQPVPFEHSNDTLWIASEVSEEETKSFLVTYHGIPKDGLIISENKFGDRTFFGDNWPNRGHNWLPSVDHPSDKAMVTFDITAPSHYQVIGNGTLKESEIGDEASRYIWATSVPIPVKVAVVGIAEFAVDEVGEFNGILVSSWVYPENKEAGFEDYAHALEIVQYFVDHVGPYPYKKLANVQSKTRFGGMENASNIFYYEESVTGKQEINGLLAHEIAPQWFGNSATEIDWPHLWLSEGFATYMTNLYLEDTFGRDFILSDLKEQRKTVTDFFISNPSAVVNTDVNNYLLLLNPNSYQKGGWVLHMLRKKLGDELFWKVIQQYYAAYTLSNASTTDFKNVAEKVSGQELDTFFEQWLFNAGHPILDTSWEYADGKLTINLSQTQPNDLVFEFPVEVEITFEDGSTEMQTLEVNQRQQTFEFELTSEVQNLIFDPNVWLLYEEAGN